MAHADIRAVNLNLLAAFDALLEEKNVTRAASKMGVTQSAMSSSLAQLRLLFEDPLFRRTPRGIEPTPLALELGEPIRRGLAAFDRALTPRSFDPRSESRTFVIATCDYVEFVLLPPLLKRLAREAPGVRLEVRPWGLQQVPKTLQSGEVELMIGFYDEIPAHHAQTLVRRALRVHRPQRPPGPRPQTDAQELARPKARARLAASQQPGHRRSSARRASVEAHDRGARLPLLARTNLGCANRPSRCRQRPRRHRLRRLAESAPILSPTAAAQRTHRPGMARTTRTRSRPALVPPTDRGRVPPIVARLATAGSTRVPHRA